MLQAMEDEKEREREEKLKAKEEGNETELRKKKKRKNEEADTSETAMSDIQKQVAAHSRQVKAQRRGTNKKTDKLPSLPNLPAYDNFEDEVAKQSRKGKKYKKSTNYSEKGSTIDPRFKPKKSTLEKEQIEDTKRHNPKKPSKKSFKSKGRYKRRK